MPYIEIDIRRPACLTGQTNGKLTSDILREVPGLGGGPKVRFVEPAMRAWQALSSTAQAAGFILKATSYYDSYRTYQVQYDTFHARYTTTPIANAQTRTCNGTTYWKRSPDLATAACPGTSNHGWALAIDLQNASGALLAWVEANYLRFGFSHELESELWHIRYWAGDDIPKAVLDWESSMTDYSESAMRAFPWQYNGGGMSNVPAGKSTLWAYNEIYRNVEEAALQANANGAALTLLKAQVLANATMLSNISAKLDAMDAKLDAILVKIGSGSGGISLGSTVNLSGAVITEA